MRRALVGTLLLLETASVPAQWVADRRVRLLMLLDAGDTVATASRVTATPTVVLLDRGGRVVGKGGGLAALAGRQGPGPVRRAAGAGALTALAGRAGPHYR